MKKKVLKAKMTTYAEVDYYELDQFVQETYGIQHFSCVAVEEWGNNSQHRINVNSKKELDQWDLEKLQKVKNGEEPDYSLRTVMQDLVNRDLIPPAVYLVNVCW